MRRKRSVQKRSSRIRARNTQAQRDRPRTRNRRRQSGVHSVFPAAGQEGRAACQTRVPPSPSVFQSLHPTFVAADLQIWPKPCLEINCNEVNCKSFGTGEVPVCHDGPRREESPGNDSVEDIIAVMTCALTLSRTDFHRNAQNTTHLKRERRRSKDELREARSVRMRKTAVTVEASRSRSIPNFQPQNALKTRKGNAVGRTTVTEMSLFRFGFRLSPARYFSVSSVPSVVEKRKRICGNASVSQLDSLALRLTCVRRYTASYPDAVSVRSGDLPPRITGRCGRRSRRCGSGSGSRGLAA